MKAKGRKKIYCSKRLSCGVWDRFSVVVKECDLNDAKSKYLSMGYTVTVL